jgi:hypothetical protein
LTDRIVTRLRRRLDAGEPVLASAGGRLETAGRARAVAVVVTDRRIVVAERSGEIGRAWRFAELPADDLTVDVGAGAVRIGGQEDPVRVVGIRPVGQASALAALTRERLARCRSSAPGESGSPDRGGSTTDGAG